MGADLILAMVVAAMITHAWEQSKRRSAAAWAEARRRAEARGEARERARQQRRQARADRFAAARSTGPTDPLWWAYSAGWLTAGALAAVGAGAVGAASGAISGSRSGYRVGRAGAKQGWKFAETWREWRTDNPREAIELVRCQRCGGWVLADGLTNTARYGQVCQDCVPGPASEPPSSPVEDEPTEWTRDEDVTHRRKPEDRDWPPGPRCLDCGTTVLEEGWVLCKLCALIRHHEQKRQAKTADGCDGTCTNSDMDPAEAERRGLCRWCAGRREYVTNFGGRHKHVPCQECRGTGKYTPKTEAPGDDEPDQPRQRIYVHAEREDGKEETTPKEITTMGELMPATSTDLSGTGEGYSDTVHTLGVLAKLLNKAYEEVQSLGDNLTANSLDHDTLTQINDLTEQLETSAPLAAKLHQHVQARHEPVAEAVASAGGSSNVATKTWYDDL